MSALIAVLALGVLVPPLHCNVPLAGQPSRGAAHSTAQQFPNGLGLLYTGAGMQTPYALSVAMTLPRSKTNKGLFYTNWLLLASRDSKAFVQIELMRWRRFSYRNEVAVTWALADGVLEYRDTPVFISNAPHTLTIGVRSNAITLSVDSSVSCVAPTAQLYKPSERLYYQIGNEVDGIGDQPTGAAWNIRAFDATHSSRLVSPRCAYTGHGLFWEPLGNGRYAARGQFELQAPARFVGRCSLTPW